MDPCVRVRPGTTGIPQGSALVSILFILYIHNLPKSIISDVILFTDDIKVFKTINSPDDHHTIHYRTM